MTILEVRRISTPLTGGAVEGLRAGEKLLLSGAIYTARDAAHRRFIETLQEGKPLPIDLRDQVIYYCGPTPAPPGRVIGAAGPTTSSRMDAYTPTLLALGLRGMIGKGGRSVIVREAIREHKAVYFGATGGAGALLSRAIASSEIVAYEDLGAEAVRRLVVKDFPVFVINDVFGDDLYEMGVNRYRMG